MSLTTLITNPDRYFGFAKDDNNHKYYLMIPVSNKMIDYVEYYEVPEEMIENYPSNINEVESFAHSCRLGHKFHLSLHGKAPDRGSPLWPDDNLTDIFRQN